MIVLTRDQNPEIFEKKKSHYKFNYKLILTPLDIAEIYNKLRGIGISVISHIQLINEVEKWCEENMVEWYETYGVSYFFASLDDVLLFKLMWE